MLRTSTLIFVSLFFIATAQASHLEEVCKSALGESYSNPPLFATNIILKSEVTSRLHGMLLLMSPPDPEGAAPCHRT